MRRRILTSILLVIAVTVLALGLPLAIVSWRLVDDLLHRELAGRLQSMESSVSIRSDGNAPIDLTALRVGIPEGGRLTLRVAGEPDRSIGAPESPDVYSESVTLAGGGELLLSVPMARLRAERWRSLLLVAGAVAVSVLVATAVALVLARRLATPLDDVARRAARLGEGDFRTSHGRYGIAELDRVADVLDSSARDIAVLLGRERDLAGDISHQLRTRLTGLRLRLEELSMHPDPTVVAEVGAALEQTDRLVTVVDDLLATARSQRAAGATVLDLGAELTDFGVDLTARVASAGRTLEIHCPAGALVRLTRVRLREAVGALVDNAVVHGAGPVLIRVRTAPGTVLLEVSDSGDGVPEAIAGHIFDRGISTASSTGIGLGLARALIEADGGRLELRRARPPVFGIFLTPGPDERPDEGTTPSERPDPGRAPTGSPA